jgi:hypothetical protein
MPSKNRNRGTAFPTPSGPTNWTPEMAEKFGELRTYAKEQIANGNKLLAAIGEVYHVLTGRRLTTAGAAQGQASRTRPPRRRTTARKGPATETGTAATGQGGSRSKGRKTMAAGQGPS